MSLPAVAQAHAHRQLIWGVVLIVLGTLHLTFRRFYARRNQAMHDARQDSAPAITRRFYRHHSSGYYLGFELAFGITMVVIGVILVVANA